MRIDGIRPAGAAPSRATKPEARKGFGPMVDSAGAPKPAVVSRPGLLSPLLPVEPDADQAGERARREYVKQGHLILDELDSVHRLLLAGRVPLERLREIEKRLAAMPPPTDQRLHDLFTDISIRVEIEIAKLEVA